MNAKPTWGPRIGPTGGSGQAKAHDAWQPGQIRVQQVRPNPCTSCGGSGVAVTPAADECSDTCRRQVCEWCPGPEGAAANKTAAEGYELRPVGTADDSLIDFVPLDPDDEHAAMLRLRMSREVWASQGAPERLWIRIEAEAGGS